VEGLQAGADYYLTKPYDSDYLLSMLHSIVTLGPPRERPNSEAIEVILEGNSYLIGAGRRQMLNLLLSTYSNAVLQNRVLLRTQSELRTVNAQLEAQRSQIEAQGRELQEVNAMLRTQAMRDSMTGLRNFRAFNERLIEEIERSRRSHEPLSLLLLDVDHFKGFNDSFGHQAGDEVLRSVARIMETQARLCDFVARYGGEEFVILLGGTPEDESRHVAERVRAAIESGPWQKRAVTVSIGISTICHATPDPQGIALLAAADKALYAAKGAGRNRIAHISDTKK
jgi:diguanylate cyclase (GGDEF)-like protein